MMKWYEMMVTHSSYVTKNVRPDEVFQIGRDFIIFSPLLGEMMIQFVSYVQTKLPQYSM